MEKKFESFENFDNITYSVIFSADYDFQVISIIEGNLETGWDIANEMFSDGILKRNNIDHYDVVWFESSYEMNKWILQEVKESRKNK